MTIRAVSRSSAIALACVIGAPLPGKGGTVDFSDTFNITLHEYSGGNAYVPGVGAERKYAGTANIALPMFDPLGGARVLEQVTLSIEMTFLGEVSIYRAPVYGGGQLGVIGSPIGGPSGVLRFTGYASTQGLKANAGFEEIAASGDNDFVMPVNVLGVGSASTLNVDNFVGVEDLNVFVCSMLDLLYPNKGSEGNAGNAGNAAGLTASGFVELVYAYREVGILPEVDSPTAPGMDGVVIPSPAAVGLGALLLSVVTCRRGRRN
jgi:hypothetical protein